MKKIWVVLIALIVLLAGTLVSEAEAIMDNVGIWVMNSIHNSDEEAVFFLFDNGEGFFYQGNEGGGLKWSETDSEVLLEAVWYDTSSGIMLEKETSYRMRVNSMDEMVSEDPNGSIVMKRASDNFIIPEMCGRWTLRNLPADEKLIDILDYYLTVSTDVDIVLNKNGTMSIESELHTSVFNGRWGYYDNRIFLIADDSDGITCFEYDIKRTSELNCQNYVVFRNPFFYKAKAEMEYWADTYVARLFDDGQEFVCVYDISSDGTGRSILADAMQPDLVSHSELLNWYVTPQGIVAFSSADNSDMKLLPIRSQREFLQDVKVGDFTDIHLFMAVESIFYTRFGIYANQQQSFSSWGDEYDLTATFDWSFDFQNQSCNLEFIADTAYARYVASTVETKVPTAEVMGLFYTNSPRDDGNLEILISIEPGGKVYYKMLFESVKLRDTIYEEKELSWSLLKGDIQIYDDDLNVLIVYQVEDDWKVYGDKIGETALEKIADLEDWDGAAFISEQDIDVKKDYTQTGYVGVWRSADMGGLDSYKLILYLGSDGTGEYAEEGDERSGKLVWEPTQDGFRCMPLDDVYFYFPANEWHAMIADRQDSCEWRSIYAGIVDFQQIKDYWMAEEDDHKERVDYILNEDGTATLTDYYTADKAIAIPEKVEGFIVTKIGDGLFADDNQIESVIIPASITAIGAKAFFNCSAIREVILYEGLQFIGEQAFEGCKSLEQLTIPDSVTQIAANAFSGCVMLQNVELPENITQINDYAFAGCISLKSVKLPSTIANIGSYAFTGCSGIESVEIGDGITEISEGLFRNCSKLKSVTLPQSVRKIGSSAFMDCSQLADVYLSDGLIAIGEQAFRNCTALVAIELPDGFESLGPNAFMGAYSMQSLVIPESLKDIGLQAVINPWTVISGAENAAMRKYAENMGLTYSPGIIEEITATPANEDRNIVEEELFFNWEIRENGTCSISGYYGSEETVIIPDTIEGRQVTALVDKAFNGQDIITCIIVPEGVESIGAKAFYKCTSLEKIVLPSSLIDIGKYAFVNCPNVVFEVIPNTYAESYAKNMEIDFRYAKKEEEFSKEEIFNQKLRSEIGYNWKKAYYADYDGDGTYEVYCWVATQDGDYLYFVNDIGVKYIDSISDADLEIRESGGKQFLVLSIPYESEIIYGVVNGQPARSSGY